LISSCQVDSVANNKITCSKDGRRFVVVSVKTLAKGPKYFTNASCNQKLAGVRIYSTRSGGKKSLPVQEIPKDLLTLAKHWKICYANNDRIFGDLRGLLKLESI
jgi:hypothetical protein